MTFLIQCHSSSFFLNRLTVFSLVVILTIVCNCVFMTMKENPLPMSEWVTLLFIHFIYSRMSFLKAFFCLIERHAFFFNFIYMESNLCYTDSNLRRNSWTLITLKCDNSNQVDIFYIWDPGWTPHIDFRMDSTIKNEYHLKVKSL